VLGLLPRQEGLDDAHAAAAARAEMLWRIWLFGLSACRSLCVGGLDGVDRDERHREHLADTRDVVGADWAGQQAVVTDAMEALWQDVHQEATDELGGIERHHGVSLPTLDAVILPLECDAVVIEREEAAVGDGDAMGVAGEIAQDFRGSPECRRVRYRRYWSKCQDETLRKRTDFSTSQRLKLTAIQIRLRSEHSEYPCPIAHFENETM